VRTLLPLVRNALAVFIAVVLTLVVLSEIGIDIAPLLAGAGVVGLAIGFGSQTLVKDVITGLFMLLEDTISVGDIVTVAGRGGVVEAITIRTIKLRDSDGSLHTIPFSTVDAVQNRTKGFGQYVFEVKVDYHSDVDAVIAALKEVDAGMRADPEFRDLILEPLDIWGLDKFEDSAIVIAARTKTLPARQWTVGRAFNKRMKEHFDKIGIVMPYPTRTIQVVTGGLDRAAPHGPGEDRRLPYPAPVPGRA
jgi:small conductance mechanosensitive channel